ncbi:hypothetical protein DF186_22895, partial [Enterococcus hirae]
APADTYLHGRLGQRDQPALGQAPLVDHAVGVEREVLGQALQQVARQQLEARLGAVVGIALQFARLDALHQLSDTRVVGR